MDCRCATKGGCERRECNQQVARGQGDKLAGSWPERRSGIGSGCFGVHGRHCWHDLLRTYDRDHRGTELHLFELRGLYWFVGRRRLASRQRACPTAELASVEQRHPIERDWVTRL